MVQKLTRLFVILFSLGTAAQARSAAATPLIHTSGTVSTNLASGQFEGDVCIADRPASAASHFSLNAGLNVVRVTDGKGQPVSFKGLYQPGINGEARVYTIDDTPPSALCVRYIGMLPVYPAHDAPTDFKGLIAFNGDSVRAAEQAAWLPIAYDDKTKERFTATAYDLTVRCAGCRFLYVNGTAPVERAESRFVSTKPALPLLFGGTGALTQTPSVTFVNEVVPAAQGKAVADAFSRIEKFYANYLGQPVGDRPTLLRMVTLDQAERDRKGSSWGFATWPTIALSGTIADYGQAILTPTLENDWVLHHLAHETAHYYFGAINDTAGPYHWMLIESGAEFMSLEATSEIGGAAMAAHRRQVLVGQLNDEKGFRPLDTITDLDQINGTYRYAYIPLLLVALERDVGRPAMRGFMRALLAAPAPQKWDDLRAIAVKGGIDGATWDRWRMRCVDDATLACVKATG